MIESRRRLYERLLALYLPIFGVVTAIASLKLSLLESLFIGFVAVLVAYLIFLKADIKDLKRENYNLKKEIERR